MKPFYSLSTLCFITVISCTLSISVIAQNCPTPSVVASPTTICSGSTTRLTASGANGRYAWYDSPSGGLFIWSGATYNTLPLFSTTTYYVQSFNLLPWCTSPRVAVTITVNQIPSAPSVSATPPTVCYGSASTLSVSPSAAGATYNWFNVQSGGTAIASGASYTTPPLSAPTTYYVQATINGCTGPRSVITVSVSGTSAPVAPTATATPQSMNAGLTSTLTATGGTGNTYQWYDVQMGGTQVGTGASFTTPPLLTNTTYYVESTNGVCTSSRTAVTVTVLSSSGSLWLLNGGDVYRPTGNVGIGTATPSAALDVIGNAKVSGNLKVGTNSLHLGQLTGGTGILENHIWGTAIGTGTEHIFIQSEPSGTLNGNTVINAQGSTGSVGIGTSAPLDKLHVNNGSVVFEGNINGTGSVGIAGPGARLVFVDGKLRVGIVDGTQWDNANIGGGVLAAGINPRAMGVASIALGNSVQALGFGVIAMGNSVTTAAAQSCVLGKFNAFTGGDPFMPQPDEPVFQIGNGTSASDRNNALTILNDGKVGIGIVNPSTELHVKGSMTLSRLNAGNQTNSLRTVITSNPISSTMTLPGGSASFVMSNDNPADMAFSSNNADIQFIIKNDGKVGIGTLCPPTKLAVDGTITAREVKVTTVQWCDYVFKSDYNLLTLDELKKFITANGHLPEVPSEAVVKEQGVGLGEMNTVLLKKIEELTLYIIDQDQRMDSLQEQVQKLNEIERK